MHQLYMFDVMLSHAHSTYRRSIVSSAKRVSKMKSSRDYDCTYIHGIYVVINTPKKPQTLRNNRVLQCTHNPVKGPTRWATAQARSIITTAQSLNASIRGSFLR